MRELSRDLNLVPRQSEIDFPTKLEKLESDGHKGI